MSDILEAMALAVQTAPGNAAFRVQYARMLLDVGRVAEAVEQASVALQLKPGDTQALDVVTRAAKQLSNADRARTSPIGLASAQAANSGDRVPTVPHRINFGNPVKPDTYSRVDWARFEAELGPGLPPPFVNEANRFGLGDTRHVMDRSADAGNPTHDNPVTSLGATSGVRNPADERATSESPGGPPHTAPGRMAPRMDPSRTRLAARIVFDDVTGLEAAKDRIRQSYIEPIRHQPIARAFGRTSRGGVLLYGPPGAGKSMLARAVAGELQARFTEVSIADIFAKFIGESDQNVHDIFDRVRQMAPAVLFLDEIDAMAGRRGRNVHPLSARAMVRQIIQELDGLCSPNDGLFVIAGTSNPWDVDPTLTRPGRLDRMVFVAPPDARAREVILRRDLNELPIAGIDVRFLVERTEGFSGSDIERLCSYAAERAMMDSIAAGEVRPIGMADLTTALAHVSPTSTAWLEAARGIVSFAGNDAKFHELMAFLRTTQPR